MNENNLARPLLVWAIIIFVVYGILGTGLNLYRSWTGGVGYSSVQTVFGLGSLAANFWLLYEIWHRRPRQAVASFVNAAIALSLYALMAIGPVARGEFENIIALLVLGGLMVGIWVAIGLYLRRIEATP